MKVRGLPVEYLGEDLLFKSPGDGIPPSEIDKVLGKKITKDYLFEENIKFEDLE